MKTKLFIASIAVLSLLSNPALSQTSQPATSDQSTTGQTTDAAAPTNRNDESNNDWGWIGLLGLIGLAGLMKRREPAGVRTNTVGSDTIRRT